MTVLQMPITARAASMPPAGLTASDLLFAFVDAPRPERSSGASHLRGFGNLRLVAKVGCQTLTIGKATWQN